MRMKVQIFLIIVNYYMLKRWTFENLWQDEFAVTGDGPFFGQKGSLLGQRSLAQQ